jgi:hypothetical protein
MGGNPGWKGPQGWNMLILREFKSFAQMEADEDAGLRRFSAPAP